jgi:CRISPR-associated exonuclease Cas4
MARDVELTVTDLKQWAYCRRIPFYRYAMPVKHAPTFKMDRGKNVQAALEALERRRRLREYGLHDGRRHFGITLRSDRLRLTGKLDLLIETATACHPVDFKDTEGGVRANHRAQLSAYSLLAEEAFAVAARDAFVYLVPTGEVVPVRVTDDDHRRVVLSIEEMRRMISDEALPDPTRVRARCTACEFRNYCADVW